MNRRRTLLTLYAANFPNAVGGWFFLPLLPIFIGRRGGSAALVGVVFAAGLGANALIRYPAGWASDRFGTRAVLVVSMLANPVLFLAYLPPLPLAAFIAERFLHGAAEGAYWRAANGLVAEISTVTEIVGALAGGVLFTLSPTCAFLSIAVVCIVGALSGFVPHRVSARIAEHA